MNKWLIFCVISLEAVEIADVNNLYNKVISGVRAAKQGVAVARQAIQNVDPMIDKLNNLKQQLGTAKDFVDLQSAKFSEQQQKIGQLRVDNDLERKSGFNLLIDSRLTEINQIADNFVDILNRAVAIATSVDDDIPQVNEKIDAVCNDLMRVKNNLPNVLDIADQVLTVLPS